MDDKIWYFNPNDLEKGIHVKSVNYIAVKPYIYSLDRKQLSTIYKLMVKSLLEEYQEKIEHHEDEAAHFRDLINKIQDQYESMGDQNGAD